MAFIDWNGDLLNFLPQLALNHNLLKLQLPSRQDHKCEPLGLALAYGFLRRRLSNLFLDKLKRYKDWNDIPHSLLDGFPWTS
jgi:hypothetical protein